jgi:DNA-binding protein HU-beta
MNKAELCEKVQHALGDDVTKACAESAVKAVLDAIADGVRRDEAVQLIGFGTFKVSHRAARMGRNPKTGEAMQINASKSVKFSPSAAFKKSL